MASAAIVGGHERHCGLGVALLACVVLWTDSFPVAAPQRATWQEVKIERCEHEWMGPAVYVSTRVLWDVETPDGTERAVIADWKVVYFERLRPEGMP